MGGENPTKTTLSERRTLELIASGSPQAAHDPKVGGVDAGAAKLCRAGLGKVTLSEWDGMNPQDRRNLEVEAVLDPDQAEALTAALKQNLTIIQGPPGTGKLWIHSLSARVSSFADQKCVIRATSRTCLVESTASRHKYDDGGINLIEVP
jgi:hypothetical protein